VLRCACGREDCWSWTPTWSCGRPAFAPGDLAGWTRGDQFCNPGRTSDRPLPRAFGALVSSIGVHGNKARIRPRLRDLPGTFDPIHNGHIDVIAAQSRSSRSDVAWPYNPHRTPALFSPDGGSEMIPRPSATSSLGLVDKFSGLSVDLRPAYRAHIIIRSLRGVTAFDYELQMRT